MTQKGSLFKGQHKKKSIPPNRHGKSSQTRKGKKVVKPSKVTKEMDADRKAVEKTLYEPSVKFGHVIPNFLRKLLELLVKFMVQELSKFINHCNEVKAATLANKDGGQLAIVKPQQDSSGGAKK